MKHITSGTNSTIKQIVALHDADARRTTGLCIVEGMRAVKTFAAHCELEQLYITSEKLESVKDIAPDMITLVEHHIMKKISTAATPSGILAVFKIPATPATLEAEPGVVLAQITDPGNMGTLIRTAAALGITSVIIIEGTDPWSPKVIQASAGTIALVKIFQFRWEQLLEYKKNLKLCALVVSGGTSPESLTTKDQLLVIGNEAHGLPKKWQDDCNTLITIPMPGNVESLNAAVAGSIALYLWVHSK